MKKRFIVKWKAKDGELQRQFNSKKSDAESTKKFLEKNNVKNVEIVEIEINE